MTNFQRTPEMGGTGDGFPITAPLLGLNTRDDYTALKPTEARVLENWLPDGGSCKVRPGHAAHQTIATATSVPSLMQFKGATQPKLIAGALGDLYEVTGAPVLLTGAIAAHTSDRWSHVNYNGFLFGVNGNDVPWKYNGTVVAATGFTGPTLTTLQTINQVRERIWCTLVNSADVVYGAVGAIAGALTTFPLSQKVAGGKCIAIGSWSRDSGDGADDLTVFIMNTGQVIAYQGDPGSSFKLIGKYWAPAPVGLDALVKVGGELVVLTVSGPIPVSAIMAATAFDPEAIGKWGKIAPSWAKDFKSYGNNLGWNAFFFNGLVYFVIPTGAANTKVYVMNARNSAWATYTKMPVSQLADLNGVLYFGGYSNGKIWRHATGSDNGAQIVTLARQGWSYPGGGNRSNQYTMMRTNIAASGPCQGQFQVDVDFKEGALIASVVDISSEGEGSSWDVGDWDVADWAADPVTRNLWHSVVGRGRAVAPVVRTFSTADEVEWFSSDIIAKQGGIL